MSKVGGEGREDGMGKWLRERKWRRWKEADDEEGENNKEGCKVVKYKDEEEDKKKGHW